jgi:hypothetical protein
LRSNNIKQEYLIKLGKHLKDKKLICVAVTKNSPLELELSSTFKKIDNYLQITKKPSYPFITNDPTRQKLCCWLEVPDDIYCGEAAGQTVFQFHCHVVPRYIGDMKNPRGGVRHCIEGKGYY